jgi:S1-C subfamily serine protease
MPTPQSVAVLAEEGLDAGQPWHFGDPLREQRRLEAGDGTVDLSHRGVLTVSGPDRLTWLHSLTTQHLESLAPGITLPGLVLDPQGHVEHAFIGVTAKSVTPQIARLFRLPAKHGLLVESVEPGSGAAAAGLRAGTDTAVVSGESWPVGGDLIVAADGRALSDVDQLRDSVAAKKPGQSLGLVIFRGNRKRTLTVKLGRQPSSPPG